MIERYGRSKGLSFSRARKISEVLAPWGYTLMRFCAGAVVLYRGDAKVVADFVRTSRQHPEQPLGLPFPCLASIFSESVEILRQEPRSRLIGDAKRADIRGISAGVSDRAGHQVQVAARDLNFAIVNSTLMRWRRWTPLPLTCRRRSRSNSFSAVTVRLSHGRA